jgi:hypothetical protein
MNTIIINSQLLLEKIDSNKENHFHTFKIDFRSIDSKGFGTLELLNSKNRYAAISNVKCDNPFEWKMENVLLIRDLHRLLSSLKSQAVKVYFTDDSIFVKSIFEITR